MRNRLILASILSLASLTTAQGEPLAPYKSTSGISGNLSSVGSDTLNNLMTLWAEAFAKIYPGVKIGIEGKGSTTAPPALTQGVAQLGPMSRAMKPSEIEQFEAKHGYPPTEIAVAIDTLTVYVHRDNPIKGMSLAQVDAIFSKTRKGGAASDIVTWGQLGLGGEWANKPISAYGRNSASGTYGFFKEVALFKGDFKDRVKEQPGSASVVNSVGNDLSGIGYSGVGYKTSEVRMVALAKGQTTNFVEPTFEAAISGQYPLGRSLLVYINKDPRKPLPKLTEEFLKFILSAEGQAIVLKDGYGALPKEIIAKQFSSLGINQI